MTACIEKFDSATKRFRITKGNSPDDAVTFYSDKPAVHDAPYIVQTLLIPVAAEDIAAAMAKENQA